MNIESIIRNNIKNNVYHGNIFEFTGDMLELLMNLDNMLSGDAKLASLVYSKAKEKFEDDGLLAILEGSLEFSKFAHEILLSTEN